MFRDFVPEKGEDWDYLDHQRQCIKREKGWAMNKRIDKGGKQCRAGRRLKRKGKGERGQQD